MPDSKKQVGYFGITTYEVLNAINPDYFIMSLYGNTLGKNYLDELRNVMRYKFNVEVDSFYVGNTEQDSYSLDKLAPIEYIHLGQLIVDKRVKEVNYTEIPVFTCSTVSQLYQSMIEKLGEYDDFQSLWLEAKMEEKIKEMIKTTLNVNIDNMTEGEKDYPLLSKKFDVMPYQMLVFFTRVEKEFGIRIPDESIVDGKFNSYNDISKIILDLVTK